MKKNFVAFALVLLLVFSMAGGAFADITQVYLDEAEAGVFFEYLLATVSTESSVTISEGSLPPGCQIVTKENALGLDVYISGTPEAVGNYSAVIDLGNGNSLVCPLNVSVSKPSAVASPDAVCSVNEILEIFVVSNIAKRA